MSDKAPDVRPDALERVRRTTERMRAWDFGWPLGLDDLNARIEEATTEALMDRVPPSELPLTPPNAE